MMNRRAFLGGVAGLFSMLAPRAIVGGNTSFRGTRGRALRGYAVGYSETVKTWEDIGAWLGRRFGQRDLRVRWLPPTLGGDATRCCAAEWSDAGVRHSVLVSWYCLGCEVTPLMVARRMLSCIKDNNSTDGAHIVWAENISHRRDDDRNQASGSQSDG